ncbi:MAG: nucleoside triphosphate pyrophosphohydrolase [Candidatus Acidiferrales bacterium]
MSKRSFEEVVQLMARLRAPDGCPWDREQTHRSLRTYLLEESYEVLDAIERDDAEALKDELGDLLLQVIFHAQMAQEQGRFGIDEVLTGLHEKLVRRHPHVFGEGKAETAQQVVHNWEALKAAERNNRSSALEGVSEHVPALLEAYQLTRKAAQVGFDWEKPEDVLAKLDEEVGEVRKELAAGETGRVEEELGDLLFVVVNLARKLKVDPEVALRRANRKFVERFRRIESELARQGKRPQDSTLAEMDALWERAKKSST